MNSLEYQDENTPPPYPPAAGCRWLYCTQPDGWDNTNMGVCWYGLEWGYGDSWYHDTGNHGLWMEVPMDTNQPAKEAV